ncbi:MAG: ArsR family transcriptional regulator [Treponema sp. RIFOXYC1_FULL_61_9]|nr:MAG: ArsR family transcriptional regulator [Treponema sp. GWA1_62_8]OHE67902.1 MAG: ArsR family transcriptional regulator [Treponema sp. GWC1_61_84]OHE75706.1 MAG: ArsR family transcriptional regulator [Treponema sp. RIFOXYC1_FULL_61_9]
MKGREFKDAVYEQLSHVAAAYGSPKRIEIIDVLAQGERNVETLSAETGLSVANTSRHLQVLKGAGLAVSRKAGLQVFYRLAGPEVVEGHRVLRIIAEARIAELGRAAKAYFDGADGMQPIGREELMERARTGDVVVLDVRPAEEYESGHIAGALSIPLEELEKRLSGIPLDCEIVAYCRGPYCVLAAEAVRLLRQRGRKAVRFAEGYPEWRDAGLPVETFAPEDFRPAKIQEKTT